MNSSIILISNPVARGYSSTKIRHAQDILQAKGFITNNLLTKYSGHAEKLARESVNQNPDIIIAAGGDGTINEVINGMVGSSIPLSILPLGTSNVLAKELGVPKKVEQAISICLTGRLKSVSLGRIDFADNTNRYFCLMAGIGFDAGIVFGVNNQFKRFFGEAAYILRGIQDLVRYHPGELFFSIDGMEYSGYSIIIGKSSRYGGNFRVTPDANILDPHLYLCIFKGNKRSDMLRYVYGVLCGNHLKNSDIVYLKADSIDVLGRAHIQADGDYIGTTPARISVIENALRLIY